ncbi:MAG: WYL domain-containing protein [Propionibacteriaceae bacterium]|nr:WYL domain-containing protein [Propionibacteriaceae bacterium]
MAKSQQIGHRLLSLAVTLMTATRFLTREELRTKVYGYEDYAQGDAFARQLGRDIQDVESMGFTVTTGGSDPASGVVDGYRILAKDALLPPIELTPEEADLVGLASTVWGQPDIAAQVGRAVTKLKALDVEINPSALDYMRPRLMPTEPAFPVLHEACLRHHRVRFEYNGLTREVDPWKLLFRYRACYLVGEQTNGSQPGIRIFKLMRMESLPVESSITFPPPDPELVRAKAADLEPVEPTQSALLAVRTGAGQALRTQGEPVEGDAPPGFDLVAIHYANEHELLGRVLEAGADVLLLEPTDLQGVVVARLKALAKEGR